MKTRYTSLFVTIFVMIFMYLPIVMLISQSFNESRYGGKWMGFSFKWYEALLQTSIRFVTFLPKGSRRFQGVLLAIF